MQINRLNLIFPPATPGAPAATAQPDALQAEAASARSASAGSAAAPARKAVAAVEPSTPPETPAAPAGVTLELGSGQKAAASGLYTRDGVFAGRASAAVDQTPAEQFVASAVNTLRDFDVNKAGMGTASGSDGNAQALPASRFGSFGSFKQAVAKLNVFA